MSASSDSPLLPSISMPPSDLHEWELNPRRGIYRSMGTMVASVQAHGIKEPLHVWFHQGQYLILQGHRRWRAATELSLAEVPVIVESVRDEREALALLLVLQEEHDGFDPLEEAVGLRSLVDLGDTAKEIGARINRSEVWVQMRLDVLKMPEEAQDAVAARVLDLESVRLLMQINEIGGIGDRDDAIEAVLHPEFQLEPLQGSAAHLALKQGFIERAEAWRAWTSSVPALRKKYPRREGFSVIEGLPECEMYAQSHGEPMTGYRYADETIDRRELVEESLRMTWGELARRHDQAIFVVCAWKHRDGHVCVVNERVLRDAEAVAGESGGVCVLKQKAGRGRGAKAEGGRMKDEGSDAESRRREEEEQEQELASAADVNEGGEGWTLQLDPKGRGFLDDGQWFATLDALLLKVRDLFERDGVTLIVLSAGPVGHGGPSGPATPPLLDRDEARVE